MDSYSSLYDNAISASSNLLDIPDSSHKFISEEGYSQIQGDILQQGKNVEDFITRNSSLSKKSESFQVLQTLFSLFKKELSMNLTLRQSLIKERAENIETNKQTNANVSIFINKVSKVVGSDLSSLRDVYEYIQNTSQMHQNDVINLKSANEKLKSEIEDIKAYKEFEVAEVRSRTDIQENECILLQQEIKDLKKKIQQMAFVEKQNQELVAKVSSIEEEKQKILNEKNEEIIGLKNQRISLEKINIDLQKTNSSINGDQSERVSELMLKLKNEKEKRKKSKKEIKDLLKQIKEQNDHHIASIATIDSLQAKISRIEERYRTKYNNMSSREDNGKLDEKRKEIKDLKKENRRLHSQLQGASEEINGLEEQNSKLLLNLDRITSEIDDLRKSLDSSTNKGFSQQSYNQLFDAFMLLREGLNMDRKLSPMSVANQILNGIQIRKDNQSLENADNLQYQIDSLQKEVESLREEVSNCV